MEWCAACWAILPLQLADEFIEAGLVRNMRAGELEYPLASESMLERLLADGALAANKGPLPSVPPPVGIHYAG